VSNCSIYLDSAPHNVIPEIKAIKDHASSFGLVVDHLGKVKLTVKGAYSLINTSSGSNGMCPQ
jgi:hypothetical protein